MLLVIIIASIFFLLSIIVAVWLVCKCVYVLHVAIEDKRQMKNLDDRLLRRKTSFLRINIEFLSVLLAYNNVAHGSK